MINDGKKRFIKGDDAMTIRTAMVFRGRMLKGIMVLALAWAALLKPLPSAAADLMHNSADTASTKWQAQGGWGVSGGKYGKFDCSTCHEPNKRPNIKNVRRVITTPSGENWPGGNSAVAVTFRNATSMGNDRDAHASSSRICEVCHSQNKFHNANTANNTANGGNLNHPTPQAVCTTCHKHNTGFKAACGGCHGNPPKEAVLGGDTGLVLNPRPSNALTAGQAGAHVTHTETRGMVCDTCHYINNGGIKMPNLSNSIDIGFFGFGGKVTSGTYTPYSSVDRGYRVASGTTNTTIASVVTDHAAANVCANVYCHGGGVKVAGTQVKAPLTGGSNQTPRWDAPSQNQCGSCHGTTPATPPTMGSHVRHSGSTGYSFSCDLCHPAIDMTHVQGNVRWALKTSDTRIGAGAGYKAAGATTATAMGSTGDMAPSAAYGECSSLYCHSDGKGGAPRQNPTWGDGTYSNDCVNCHGNNAQAVATMTSNGHRAHVANTSPRFAGFDFRCQECHNATVDASDTGLLSRTLHANRTPDVSWGPDAGYVPSGGTSTLPYNPAQTCTVYCHSNGRGVYKAPPQTWNSIADGQQGTIECNYCHNGLAGMQNQMTSGRHKNHIGSSPLPHRPIACNWCHSNTVAANGVSVFNGTDVKHINRTIDINFIKMANFSGSYSTSTHVCSNTYCHTNNAATASRDWDTTTVNTCGNCHEANNSTTASATLSPAHRKHYNTSTRPSSTTEQGWTNVNNSTTANVFMCGVCHPGNPTTSHVNGPPTGVTNGSVAEVAIRLPFTPPTGATRPETVNRGTGVNYDGRGYGYSTGTTCDTYCHSDGRGNPGKRNADSNPKLEWTTGTGVVCGNCHNQYGDANPTWSGSHSKHLSGSRSTNATCNACHAATAADNTTLIANRRDKHPNGFRNVTGNSIAGAFRWDSTSQQCTNVYCHFNKPVTWGGQLAGGCISCHGYKAGSGDPIATKGHTAHVNNTSPRFAGFDFACYECHAGTVNTLDNLSSASLHANRVNNVAWGTKSAGGLAYITNGCTQIYCHSNGAGVYKAPPTTWNNIAQGQQGTIECNYCHNGLAGVQYQMSSGRHLNHISAGPLPHKPITCNWCHANTVAANGQSVFNGTEVKHINRVVDVNFKKFLNFSGSFDSTHVCTNTYCHGNNSTTTSRDWDTTTVNTCGNCHEANNSTTATATLSPAHRKHYNRTTRPSSTTEQGWTNVNLSTSTNVFMCGVCHPGSPTESHLNGPPVGVTNGSVAEVVIRPPFSTPQGAGRPETVFRGTGVNYDGRGYGYSTGTSCDTYCHSDGRGGLGKRNYANTADLVQSPMTSVLRWTGRAAACGDCHNKASDNPASPFTTWSKPHNMHANTYGNGGTIGSNNTTTNNTLVTCAACHASTASSNTALVTNNRSRHPNGFRNISASSTVGSSAFRWDPANNQCKNGYCHSRAYSFTDYSTPWIKWNQNEAQIHCGSCHTTTPSGPEYINGYKGKANSHQKHDVEFGFTCDYCHNATVAYRNVTAIYIANVRNHVNKGYNVVANGTKTFIGKPVSFTAVASTNPPITRTTCSNVNCHGGAASKVFTWGGTNKCGDCHFGTADTVNYEFKNSTMATIARAEWSWSGHGKQSGSYDVTGTTFAGFSSAAATAGGAGDPCLYCHEYDNVSHGDTANPLRLRNFNHPTWGKNGVCLVCHASVGATGVTPATGYTAKTATRKVDKFHYGSKHSSALNSGQFCWDCHDSHGDRTSSNGGPIAMVQMKPSLTSNPTTGVPTSFTANNVTFVAKAAPADWAKTAAPFTGICNVCHTYKDTDPNKMVHYTATSSDGHNSTIVCTQCHKHSATTVYEGTAYKGAGPCDSCHGATNNGSLSAGIDTTPVTNAGHAIHYNQATVFNNLTGSNKTTSSGYGFACKNCHPTTMHEEGDGRADILAGVNYTYGGTTVSDTKGYVYTSGGTCGTNQCHQDGRGGPARVATVTWTAAKTGNCGICHGNPPTYSITSSVHRNQTPSTSCNGCHSHINPDGTIGDALLHLNGTIEGGSDCLGCHKEPKGVRAAIAGQFASQSHHVQGGETLTNAQCYKCHWEANENGTINSAFHGKNSQAGIQLVIWNGITRPTTATMGTTYISYTANGTRKQIGKLNQHCLSCHNSTNAATTPFGTYRTDQYSPEQRLVTPQANTSIQSRYSSTRLVAWSNYLFNNSSSGAGAKYGTNQKNKVTKALSAHGNAVKNQFPQWDATANGRGDDEVMADSAASATLSANRNVFCYDCHNSHGSEASGITSSYSSATGRNRGGLLKTTKAGQGGYTVDYTPMARTVTYRNFSSLGQTLTNVAASTGTFNPGASICNDCHNNDTRKVNITKPWSITNTYSSTRAIIGYWSTPYFDNYTVNSALRTTYKMGGAVNAVNDRRKPMGGHFGGSVANTHAAAGKTINGLCTPCHDPHGVSNALGAERDHGVPLLKGTWVTSPYREDRAGVLVKRGGGSRWAGMNNMGAAPGYHIDQNTFMASPAPLNGGASTVTAKGNLRSQNFRSFANTSSVKTLSGYPGSTWSPSVFAGLCTECHNQQSLTGATTNTASAAWLSKQRIHQSVSGWSSTNGTNSGNKVHAYTCSKCHAPHVSRLPRLLITNCLDSRHFGRSVSTSIVSTGAGTNTPGNIHQSFLTSSALGAGRFPGGGAQYSGSSRATTQAQNIGGWWFQRSKTHGTAPSTTSGTGTGSLCHNSTTAAGSATYNPLLQKWNKKSVW